MMDTGVWRFKIAQNKRLACWMKWRLKLAQTWKPQTENPHLDFYRLDRAQETQEPTWWMQQFFRTRAHKKTHNASLPETERPSSFPVNWGIKGSCEGNTQQK